MSAGELFRVPIWSAYQAAEFWRVKSTVAGFQKGARAIEIHRSPAHSAGFQMPCKWKSGVYSSLAEVRSCVNPSLMPQSAM